MLNDPAKRNPREELTDRLVKAAARDPLAAAARVDEGGWDETEDLGGKHNPHDRYSPPEGQYIPERERLTRELSLAENIAAAAAGGVGRDLVASPLDTALRTVQERRAVYGDAPDNFQNIADFWTIALVKVLKPGARITTAHVAQLSRLVKEARLIQSPDHVDSLVDIAGYADLQAVVTQVRPSA